MAVNKKQKRATMWWEAVKKALILSLMNARTLAFMQAHLEKLTEAINSGICLGKYQNGIGWPGTDDAGSLDAYKAMIEDCSDILKWLEESEASRVPAELVETKEQRIRAELGKLKKLTKGMESGKKALALMNAEELAFMRVTLEDLRAAINSAGCVEGYQNGANQFGKKTTADLNAYNALVKNYAYTLKRFEEMVPEGEPGGGALAAFLSDD